MANLTAAKRRQLPAAAFGLPKIHGFPMNDPTHDRLAISGATRSQNAGNISKATADHIKAEARRKLKKGG
ncbi:MAG: hypothetical protein ACYC9K_00965 [Sulfuricaulis sp.]